MLFTDSDIITAADLQRVDSEVISVAQTSKPSIVLDGPGSICEQAWGECANRILAAQQMYACYFAQAGVSVGHNAAVLYTGLSDRNQARIRLNQVVAHESQYSAASSPVQLWMAYTALRLAYRDASSRKGQDRFQEKFERYQNDADFQWGQLRNIGLPIVMQPLDAPGAKHLPGAGTWSNSNLSTVAGSGTDQTLVVAITWVDASRYLSETNQQNAESAPSGIATVSQAAGQVLRVDISSLNPPTGKMPGTGTSQGIYTPLNATHWILWAGLPGGSLYQQAVVSVATKQYTLAGDPVLSGSILGPGQYPDLNLQFQNIVGRG